MYIRTYDQYTVYIAHVACTISVSCIVEVPIRTLRVYLDLFLCSLALHHIPAGFVSVIVTRRDDPIRAIYIMVVATVLGILVPFTFTVLTKYLVDYLMLHADESREQEIYELVTQEESEFFTIDIPNTVSSVESTSSVDVRRLLVCDHIIAGVHQQEFQSPTTAVLMLTLMGLSAVMCGIQSCM